MVDASVWTYPWDLYDEGVDRALRSIHDEGGLNGISLTANYHSSRCLLPHNPRRKVFFSESGALHFVPRPERYGRIKPRVSSLAKETDVWNETARVAEALGMKLKAWTICNHSTALGVAYPDCAIQNAFGDSYPHSLCPGHPDVRAYVVALICDLTSRYPVDAVELESVGYMGFGHEAHHEKVGIAMDAWHTFLMGLCFCSHCTAAATRRGVDVERVRRTVCDTLNAFFAADLPAPAVDASMLEATRLALESDDFRGYLNARMEVVTTLVREIREAVWQQTPSTRILCFADPYGAWRQGIDLHAIRQIADGFITSYSPTGREMISCITRLRMLLGEDVRLVAAVKAVYPHTALADDVAERIHACLQVGVKELNFYNYGLMRKAGLRAIQRALAVS